MNQLCQQLGIPERLHRNGRGIDNEFLEDELIYRRFKVEGNKEDWLSNSQISTSIFKVSNDSCNRSKYSEEPEDVLFNIRPQDEGKHYIDWGILSLQVHQLNQFSFPIQQNSIDRIFSIKVEHVPDDCMYPHSEIRVFVDGELISKNKPSSINRAIRDFLIEQVVIVKEPQF